MPKISVIMGVYNSNIEYLCYSINSILNQTFKDFEFLICDDGSTNDTLRILYSFKEKDPRIKIFAHNKNMGLSFALNTCINNSSSKYIARMDDDDFSHPDRLLEQYNFMEEQQNVGIVGSNVNLFNEDGIYMSTNASLIITKQDFLFNSPLCHPSIMARKEVYLQNGLYSTKKNTLRCEDYEFFMRCFANGVEIRNIKKCLLDYRENRQSYYKRKKFAYRWNEFLVRIKGYKKIGILFPKGIVYAMKPIVVGLIPNSIYVKIKTKNKYKGEITQ